MSKVIITADLGHFKAYRVVKDPEGRESTRIELIEAHDVPEAHGHDSDRMSDSPGAFRRSAGGAAGGALGGAAPAGSGYGERHAITTEREKRIVRRAADSINSILVREGLPKWHLSAGKRINKILLEHLAPLVKARLEINLKADLTKTDKMELLGRFQVEG